MPFFKLSFVYPKRQYSSENFSLLLRSYDKIIKGNMCDLTLRSDCRTERFINSSFHYSPHSFYALQHQYPEEERRYDGQAPNNRHCAGPLPKANGYPYRVE